MDALRDLVAYLLLPTLVGWVVGRMTGHFLGPLPFRGRRREYRPWQWEPPPAPPGEGRRPTFTLPCDDEDIA